MQMTWKPGYRWLVLILVMMVVVGIGHWLGKESSTLPTSQGEVASWVMTETEPESSFILVRRDHAAKNPFGHPAISQMTSISAHTVSSAVAVPLMRPVLRGWLGMQDQRLALIDIGAGTQACAVGESIGVWRVTDIAGTKVRLTDGNEEIVLIWSEE